MQDYSETFVALKRRLDEAHGYLRVDELRARLPQLEAEMSRPDLWDDADQARAVQTELSAVTDDLQTFDRLTGALEDTQVLYELAAEEGDDSHAGEIDEAVAGLDSELDELELRSLFTGEFDERDAVCLIKSGEGGTDAQDWAEMLLRMYGRWAERRGFEFEVVSASEGTEAGLSSAEFMVRGRHA